MPPCSYVPPCSSVQAFLCIFNILVPDDYHKLVDDIIWVVVTETGGHFAPVIAAFLLVVVHMFMSMVSIKCPVFARSPHDLLFLPAGCDLVSSHYYVAHCLYSTSDENF